jgi:hypothetical protein
MRRARSSRSNTLKLLWLISLVLLELTAKAAYSSSIRAAFRTHYQQNGPLDIVRMAIQAPRRTSLLASYANEIHGDDLKQSVPQRIAPPSFRRTAQRRRLSISRKPKGYWQKIGSLECEIKGFWSNLGIGNRRGRSDTLCIPNEALCKSLLPDARRCRLLRLLALVVFGIYPFDQ